MGDFIILDFLYGILTSRTLIFVIIIIELASFRSINN